MAVTPFTTEAAMIFRMSQIAHDLRLDDETDIPDTIAQVIADASVEVLMYCGVLYSVPALQGSAVIEKCTREIAIYYLCLRRLNKPPASVQAQYDKTIEYLEKIQAGKMILPDAAQSRASAPTLSQPGVREDMMPAVVIDSSRSTGPVPVGYAQNTEPFDWGR